MQQILDVLQVVVQVLLVVQTVMEVVGSLVLTALARVLTLVHLVVVGAVVEIDTLKHYLIIDLEATCCNKGSIKREEMEIIEIGAVMVNATSLKIVDEYEIFIKPIVNPTLTPFCKTLTTITQEDVNNAMGYKEALADFKKWYSQYDDFLFCSWGDYDKNQFLKECKMHNVAYPFNREHLNIKKAFAKVQGIKPCGLDVALVHVNLELVGTHHRGINDARNMGRLMPFIVNR